MFSKAKPKFQFDCKLSGSNMPISWNFTTSIGSMHVFLPSDYAALFCIMCKLQAKASGFAEDAFLPFYTHMLPTTVHNTTLQLL